jgi:thioredoxin-like negative regulator of GroEL
LSFYQISSSEQPRSIRLRMLNAAELMAQGRLQEANAVAQGARQLLPHYDEVWIQSADIALRRGQLDEAESYLRRAMQLGRGMKAANRLQQLFELRSATTMPERRDTPTAPGN